MRPLAVYWLLLAGVCLFPIGGYAELSNTETDETTQVEPIPYKEIPATPQGSITRVLVVLSIAIGLCVVTALLIRRFLTNKGLMSTVNNERIMVAGSRRITPKLTVFLINIDSRCYVLAQNGDQLQLMLHDTKET